MKLDNLIRDGFAVDGWLASLLAAEVGAARAVLELDTDARELLVEGRRLPLTPLEFGVIHYLMERPGKAVSRTSLLNDVWGLDYEGGSNVVDSVIAALRRNLGGWARLMETVTGTGYLYERDASGAMTAPISMRKRTRLLLARAHSPPAAPTPDHIRLSALPVGAWS